jgi:TfoX/Sxy family transcriptional regulator of competence genes
MPYSRSLADRIRQALAGRRGITERKMFGGLVFFLDGKICVGIWHQSLIARIGVDQAAAALKQPHIGPFDVTGRPMKGWIMVEPDGLDRDTQLRDWIDQSLEFVATLPTK